MWKSGDLKRKPSPSRRRPSFSTSENEPATRGRLPSLSERRKGTAAFPSLNIASAPGGSGAASSQRPAKSDEEDNEYASEVVSSPASSGSSLLSPPHKMGAHFLFPEPSGTASAHRPARMTSAEMLEALNRPVTNRGPLLPKITLYPGWVRSKPVWAIGSQQVEGSNQDCVIAAFRSAKGESRNESPLDGRMTSTDEGIRAVAALYGMREIQARDLENNLPKVDRNQQWQEYATKIDPNHKRAFIQAPALYGGPRNYHAYAAFAIDRETRKVIAWDPDNNHLDLKLVPISLIKLTFI